MWTLQRKGHYAGSVNVLSIQETRSKLGTLRLIHAAFVVTIPLVAWVAQNSCPSASNDRTLWHWVITGLALYSALVGFSFRRKLMRRSEDAPRNDASNPKAVRQWRAAHFVGWAAAEAIAFYGVVLQMVLGGSIWEASFFYAVALLLLLLWTPRRSTTALSA